MTSGDPGIRQAFCAAAVVAFVLTSTGCSVKEFAISKLVTRWRRRTPAASPPTMIPNSSVTPLPFALKLMEGLLDQVPQHRGLLFATSSGFTQYSYVWVQQPADEMEQVDVERARSCACELVIVPASSRLPFAGLK